MTEKIEKLLESSILDDVLLGIYLASLAGDIPVEQIDWGGGIK